MLTSPSRVINLDLPLGPLAPILLPAPLPAGRPRPRFSPEAGASSSEPTLCPVLGSTLRVTLRPVEVCSMSCKAPRSTLPTLGRSARGFFQFVNGLLSSSATSSPWPPRAFFIASAATSPSISSTSFLAPAILSANVILSLGSARAANLFCFGVIEELPSLMPTSWSRR